MDYKKDIANLIDIDGVEKTQIEKLITTVSNSEMGDYALPCFTFSKLLRKSPQMIAENIMGSIASVDFIEKIEAVNGYLNFYLNKESVSKSVIKKVLGNNDIYKENLGDGKVVCIDYSSANLAKYMHIGHLSTTMIGEAIARLLENFGYKVVRINYIGDYGTPFGKMIAAYKMWGNKKDIDERGVDAIQDLYVKFSNEVEKNPELIDKAREAFKDIEDKKGQNYEIYKWFIDISIKEAKRLLDYLGVSFDSWKGEAAYTDDMPKVVKELEEKGLLVESQGAKIVDLEAFDLGACLIQKSDGASLYATRDIAAAKSRYEDYKFDKMIYVTAVQQKQHFAQLFKVLNLMGYDFAKNMHHVYYGMFSLTTGKIASRKGRQAVLVDLLEMAEDKVEEIIADKNFSQDKKVKVKQSIAKAALIYSAVKNSTNKDSVLDLETAFNVEGDTSSYILYSYARVCSILRKFEESSAKPDYKALNNIEAFDLVKHMIEFKDTLKASLNEYEPSIIAKKVMDMAKALNKFYSRHKVIEENLKASKAKVNLLKAVNHTLKYGLDILNIDVLEEM
jgi:arginyl-tRNA synthetase